MQAHTNSDFHLQLDPAVLRPLFRIKPWRHALAILVNWLIIGLTVYLSLYVLPAVFYPLAVLVIGARMHALAILMHDATHYRFLKNRYWNDLLTNLTTMYPLFTTIEAYRQNHLLHHQHLNTDQDPDWVAKLGKRTFSFPKSKRAFLLGLGSYLLMYKGISDAIWFLKRFQLTPAQAAKTDGNRRLRLLYYAVLFGLLALTNTWLYFLLFWGVPYLSAFFMFQYIRSVAEHYGELAYDNALSASRTTIPNLLERFFLAPHQVGYHLEHHLYPGVPFYNLPQLHHLLIKLPEYQQQAHITQGYTTGLLRELGATGIQLKYVT